MKFLAQLHSENKERNDENRLVLTLILMFDTMHKQFIIAPSPDANGQGAFGRPMSMGDRSIKKLLRALTTEHL